MQDKNSPNDKSQMPSSIWMLGFVSMLMDISSEIIHSLLPLFMATVLSANIMVIGIIEGLGESTALIVKIFSGALSDYLGKRKSVALLGYTLGALTKPLFAIAQTSGDVLTARLLDRVGKGMRSAPRDALIADIAPQQLRGSAFGLRQALDTVGAVIGPLLAVGLMFLLADNFRAVFWIAAIPGILAAVLLMYGVKEISPQNSDNDTNPINRSNLKRLDAAYWWVVGIGSIITLARFSEAFLVLRAMNVGIPITLAPLVIVIMNITYAISAYPFGKLADHISRTKLLSFGVLVLILADTVLAMNDHWSLILLGVSLWGLHMGMTQGLLATMVADTAPIDLRGTSYGFFNLASGLMMLIASGLAGLLWDKLGPSSTFYMGAIFCVMTLFALILRQMHLCKQN